MMSIKLHAVHFSVKCPDQKFLRVVEMKIGQGVNVSLGTEAEQVHLTKAVRTHKLIGYIQSGKR